jgi:dihydroorotate dehydrogenase electron transfer subunit
MKIFDVKITHKVEITQNYFLLTCAVDSDMLCDLGQPGQFYQLQLHAECFQFRVPISIFDISEQTISFLIKIVGSKTQSLANMEINDTINLLGPLGNTWFSPYLSEGQTTSASTSSPPPQNTGKYRQFPTGEHEQVLLVSGGIGYAALHYLYNSLGDSRVVWINGGRNLDEVHFSKLQNKAKYICTDDGSIGIKGMVTDIAKEQIAQCRPDVVYACGPQAMLRSLWELCKANDIPLIVSLEEYMACGVGVCYGCAVKVKCSDREDFARVCKDGPVFFADDVVW